MTFGDLSPASYVQSGLVCQLDGIQNTGGSHSASATTWTDIKGTYSFDVDPAVATWTANGLTKSTTGVMAVSKSDRASGIVMVEAALSGIPTDNNMVMPIHIADSQYIGFRDNGTRRWYMLDQAKWGVEDTYRPLPLTVSAVYTSAGAVSCYQNGTAVSGTSHTDDWNSSGTKMSLGSRTTAGQYSGDRLGYGYTIHAIRLYILQLSVAEVRHNAVVDSIRFHGITPSGYRVNGTDLECRVEAGVADARQGGVSLDGSEVRESVASDWTTSLSSGTLSLSASPKFGYEFECWTGDTSLIRSGSATTETITVGCGGGGVLTANFKKTAANWCGLGADTLVSTVANWTGLQDFSNGEAVMSVPAVAVRRATLPANDVTYAFKQVEVVCPNFTFDAVAGAKAVRIGSGGLLLSGSPGVTWDWPTRVGETDSRAIDGYTTTAPEWRTAQDSSLRITAPLSGNDVYFCGMGRVDICSKNEIPVALIGGNNANESGRVVVYQQPGARIVKAGGLVRVSCLADAAVQWGFHLMGGTHDFDLQIGTANDDTPGGLFVEAGTTNILNGSYTTLWSARSYIGIKGYLDIRGGVTALSNANPWGSWRPFTLDDRSYSTGYLRISEKPIVANRVHIPRGTLELAAVGNTFAVRGLFVEGGLVKTTVSDALRTGDGNKLKLSKGTVDLCGFDQGVDFFYGNGGTVTSAGAAQLRVRDNDYFEDTTSQPALGLGANATACTTCFRGRAGLSKEGSRTLNLASGNASDGRLSVSNGRLVMSAADPSATFDGTDIVKTPGSWTKGSVEVTGGTLAVEHDQAFSKEVTLRLTGGTAEIAAGVTADVGTLYLDGAVQPRGTYGSPSSAAEHKSARFTGTGVIRVHHPQSLAVFFPGNPLPAPSDEPDLKFGVVSDIHIWYHGQPPESPYDYGYDQTFIELLQYFKQENVDAVVIAGDFTHSGLPEQMKIVTDDWDAVFPTGQASDGRPVEKIFIYGNHDSEQGWFDWNVGKDDEALKARSISRNEQKCWEDYVKEPWQTAFIKTVKGYKFLCAQWLHENDALALLTDRRGELAGDKPFFYIQHAHLPGGLYGEYVDDPQCPGLVAALSAYPNAVTFTGHSHYSAAFEASIHQDAFTSVGTSTLCYISKFGGALNANRAYTTRDGREAFIVTVKGNQVRIKRREVVKNVDLGPDWVFETPVTRKAKPYSYENQQARLKPPAFASGAKLSVALSGVRATLTVPTPVFDADHARVIWFDVGIRRFGERRYSCVLHQDGFFNPLGQIPSQTTFTLSDFDAQAGDVVEVQARDFYGRLSAPLTATLGQEN